MRLKVEGLNYQFVQAKIGCSVVPRKNPGTGLLPENSNNLAMVTGIMNLSTVVSELYGFDSFRVNGGETSDSLAINLIYDSEVRNYAQLTQ